MPPLRSNKKTTEQKPLSSIQNNHGISENNNDPSAIFSRNKWLELFNNDEHQELSENFIRVFQHFASTPYFTEPAENNIFINDFVETFMFLFCHPDFKIPPEHVSVFLNLHMLIANVVAMSDFETTTPWVCRLMMRNDNFIKLLTLHNVRSGAPIDPARIFDVDPFLASGWWTYYWCSAPAFCTKILHQRIMEHLDFLDKRFMIFGSDSRGSYFPVSYVAPEMEQSVKGRISILTAKAFSNVVIRNKPNRKKIAIATSRWYRSAIYTSVSPLIKSLKDRYNLTLIHNGDNENNICDRDMFERLITIKLLKEQMDLEELQDNEFSALIYPDIGLTPESVYMCNIRVAPVQISMYGHPTSTWSTHIDYFIGGHKIEVLENAEKNYSERLVVIPGIGLYPIYPDNVPAPTDAVSGDTLIINCGWTSHKVGYPLVCALQEILKRAKRRVVFRMFTPNLAEGNSFIPFVKDINSMLGAENVLIMPLIPQRDYITILCQGSFSIDSYPFGGFNTVIDALSCKKPVVAWQGDRAFNRFTAATLDMIGMPELIAHSHKEYVEIVSRMINDDNFRKQETAKVVNLDLKGAFAKEEEPEYFLKAIDYLIDNHDQLKAEGSRKPIVIE